MNQLQLIIVILVLIIVVLLYLILLLRKQTNLNNLVITGKYKEDVFNAMKEQSNLCSTDKNFYPICLGNLGIPRCFMPQFEDKNSLREFEDTLKMYNIKSSIEEIDPIKLKGTQREIESEKVHNIVSKQEADPNFFENMTNNLAPIMVSNDNYIIDGHHRWSSMLVFNLKHKENKKLKIKKYDAPIRFLLKISNSVPSIQFKDC